MNPGIIATTRVKFYKKSGARLYLPEDLVRDPSFPFKDDDLVKIEMRKNSLTISRPEWWELLNWSEMREAYVRLPAEIRANIAERGLAPSSDDATAEMGEDVAEKDKVEVY